MKNIKPNKENTGSVPDSTEEEILFPLEKEDNLGTYGKKRKSLSFIKILFGVSLLITVFYMGYSIQPEKMNETIGKMKSLKEMRNNPRDVTGKTR